MSQFIHNVKCWPAFYRDIKNGIKNFDLRRDDRKYEVMDCLCLREYDPDKRNYTGRGITKQITYILRDFPGIEKGYCILSLKDDF